MPTLIPIPLPPSRSSSADSGATQLPDINEPVAFDDGQAAINFANIVANTAVACSRPSPEIEVLGGPGSTSNPTVAEEHTHRIGSEKLGVGTGK